MMETLLDSRTPLSDIFGSRKTLGNIDNSNIGNIGSAHIIGVFSHHRDVKVALEELIEAGFPTSSIGLTARNCQRHSWLPEVGTNNCFDEEVFSFDRAARKFFQRLFQRGKYLMLVTGNERDVFYAGSIMGRRRGHSEVWHCE